MTKNSRRHVIEKVSVNFRFWGILLFIFVSYDLPVECIVSRDPKYLSVLYKVSLVSSHYAVGNLSHSRSCTSKWGFM